MSNTVDNYKFQTYILRVLRVIHPDHGISGDASATMVNFVKINVAKIVRAVNQLMQRTGTKTISSRDIQAATRIVLPGELARHAVSEGTKAVTKYNSSEGGSRGKPVQRGFRAGLAFNIARIENLMMLESSANRKSSGAAIYLSAVIEYLTAEVLELAGNAARDSKRSRINPRHIKLAIVNDEELYRLYSDTVIAGGVLPNIHAVLLPKKKEPKVATKPKPKAKTSAKKSAKKD